MSTNTLVGSDLAAALTAVLPMAGTDDTLPVLASVKFETRDGELVLATTDRYCLGTYRLDWEGDDVDFLLARRDAQELLTFAKKARTGPVILAFTERTLQASDFDRTVTYQGLDAQFPKVWAMVPEHDSDRQLIGLNPHILAKFAKGVPAKAGTTDGTMRVSIGSPVKPVRVEIGERFLGLVMPVRLPDAEVKPEVAKPEVKPEPEPVAAVEPAPEPEVDEPVVEAEEYVEDLSGEEAPGATCSTCRGYGVVRASGAKAGQAYKTRSGAQSASSSTECPTCEGDGFQVVAA